MHRFIDYCSDRLWIVVAIIILVVSGYVTLGRYLANSVHHYHADVVELLERSTGLHAKVGKLSGRWRLFTPVIEINQVNLFLRSEADEPIISAKKITLELDVLASFLVQEPRLVKLSVYGLDLSLQRNAEGEYGLLGLNKAPATTQPQNDILPLFLRQELLTLHDSSITIILESGGSLIISDLDIGFKRFAGFYQLAASTVMSGQALRLVAEVNGNLLEWDTNDMELYLNVGKGDLFQWLPKDLVGDLEKRTSITLNQWHAGMEIWAEWHVGKLTSVRGFVDNDQLGFNYKNAKEPVLFSQMDGQFQLDINKNIQLQLHDFTFNLGDATWPKSNINLNLNLDAATADVQIDQGELAPLSALLLQSGVLNDSIKDMLLSLKLEGTLNNTLVHLEKDSYEAFYLSTSLNRLKSKQWKNIPAIDGLSGQIQLEPRKGLVQIESEQLGLASPHYFRQALQVDTLQGTIFWQVDDNYVKVKSGDIKLSNPDVKGMFVFGVKVPLAINENLEKKGQQQNASQSRVDDKVAQLSSGADLSKQPQHVDPELSLTARFDNIVAQSLSHYLPPTLPKDVLQWLDKGLIEGQLDGHLVYHGSLNWKNPTAQHTLQTQLNFVNASVDYLPEEWPLLSGASGTVFIDESNVWFTVEEGEIWKSSVEITQGFVGTTLENPPVHVSLTGNYKSTTQDAIRLLNESPLKEVIGGIAETWEGTGAVDGSMTLSVPLVKTDNEMALNVVTKFQKASLSLPDFDLIFSNLNGPLYYNQSDGLISDGLKAYLFGYPANIVLPKLDEGGGTLFRLDLDSQISLRTLADWSRQPILSFMDGVINYHGELSVVNPDSVTTILRISSDTEGMEVNLPPPFEKSKEQARFTLFQMLNQGEDFHYYIHQDQTFDSYIKMQRGQLDALRLVIGEEKDIPEGRTGVFIAGSLDKLQWDVWERNLNLLESRYEKLEENNQNLAADTQAGSESFIDRISSIDLRTKQFEGFGLQVENLTTNIIRQNQSWWVNARSEMVKGVFKVPDDERPIKIDLDYFYLLEEEQAEPTEQEPALKTEQTPDTDSPVLSMKPAEFPAMAVKIADLQIDGWKLGQWSFTGNPVEDSYFIEDMKVKVAEQTLSAKVVWRPEGKQSITEIKGEASGKDVGKLMAAWGHVPTIETSSSSLNFEASWPYSPLDFSFDKISGNAKLKIKDGRFLDVGAASAIRVLGILNFTEVGRRLRLDFGDLIKPGHSFNRIEGPLSFQQGSLKLEKIDIHSPSSTMTLSGDMNLLDDSLNMAMDVELEITKNLVAIAALVGGPAAGGGMFLIDRLVGDRIAKIARLKYGITGSINNPSFKPK